MGTRRSKRKLQRQVGPSHRGLRTCIGCRGRFAPESLIRLVCDPTGHVFVDRVGKAPGRGAHLCYSGDCVRRAVRSRGLGRAFRRSVKSVTAEELLASAVNACDERITANLSIGKRAGWVRSGMDVLAHCRSQVKLFVLSVDVAPDSARRVRSWGHATGAQVIDYGDRFALGATQGKPARVALGVVDEVLASRLSNDFDHRERVLVAGPHGNR